MPDVSSLRFLFGDYDLYPPHVDPELTADAVWVPPGREVTVRGYTLSGGMVYVGSGLVAAGSNRWRLEPALIDPGLRVDRKRPDRVGAHLGPWHPYLSYDDLEPASRAAYLEWLAAGRDRPDVAIGYVYLYFFGLERRFLEDRRRSAAARREAPRIVAEVERLAALYGGDGEFGPQVRRFLDFARLALGRDLDHVPDLAVFDHAYGYVDDRLRLTLAHRAAHREPIPAAEALAWCRHVCSLRTPAHRCAELFRPLFERHYRQAFGPGLRLEPTRTRLAVVYRAASGGLGARYSHQTELPDVTPHFAQVRKIREVTVRATDELDAYSRWLGRNAGADNPLPGLALVPRAVFHLVDGEPRLRRLRDTLRSACAGAPAVLPAGELIAHWPTARSDRLTRKEAAGLAQLLERLGYGLEPDVRFGGPPLKADRRAVVFPLQDDSASTASTGATGTEATAPSREYSAATVLLHLATAVAAAGGTVSEREEEHLERHLEEALHLAPGERRRLRVHLRWLLTEQPGLAGMKRRLAELDAEQRHAIAAFALTVAGADGRIDPQQVQVLTRIYDLLGLDAQSVYRDIHALEAGDGVAATDAPRTVVPGRPRPAGYRIPPQPDDVPREGFRLDMDKVRAKWQESAETARILDGIFREDDEDVPVSSPAAGSGAARSTDTAPPIAGLDALHCALLRSLANTTSLPRGDFDARAEELGLLPAGALDLLNDAAFEICDEPVLEGDDPLEVNRYAMEEMTAG